jgi:hypothetical protein
MTTTTNTSPALTEAQFSAAQDKIDGMARTTRRGTAEEKAAFAALNTEWETAYALPARTADQRSARLAAIAAVATKHGL